MSDYRLRCALTLEHFYQRTAAEWAFYLGLPEEELERLREDLYGGPIPNCRTDEHAEALTLYSLCEHLSLFEQYERWNQLE